MLLREVAGLQGFGFGDVAGVRPGDAFAALMHIEHDLLGSRSRMVKNAFQHKHDEFHRRVIIVIQHHMIGLRFSDLDTLLSEHIPFEFLSDSAHINNFSLVKVIHHFSKNLFIIEIAKREASNKSGLLTSLKYNSFSFSESSGINKQAHFLSIIPKSFVCAETI